MDSKAVSLMGKEVIGGWGKAPGENGGRKQRE